MRSFIVAQFKHIFELLEAIDVETSRNKKLELLKQYDCKSLRTILKGGFCSSIEFDLPVGEPPYTPCDHDKMPIRTIDKRLGLFKHFVVGNGVPRQDKREGIFIDMLETLHPKEAQLIVAMKDKKIKYKGLTVKLIEEAFPGLINVKD